MQYTVLSNSTDYSVQYGQERFNFGNQRLDSDRVQQTGSSLLCAYANNKVEYACPVGTSWKQPPSTKLLQQDLESWEGDCNCIALKLVADEILS